MRELKYIWFGLQWESELDGAEAVLEKEAVKSFPEILYDTNSGI